jgi:hypothetical protein
LVTPKPTGSASIRLKLGFDANPSKNRTDNQLIPAIKI